jgi:hypothetical protein
VIHRCPPLNLLPHIGRHRSEHEGIEGSSGNRAEAPVPTGSLQQSAVAEAGHLVSGDSVAGEKGRE